MDYQPKLTPDKCRVLQEYNGCYKCRRLNIIHCTKECTIVLSGKEYKPITAPITASDAAPPRAATSTSKGCRHGVAIAATGNTASISDTECKQDLVAVLFPKADDSNDADELNNSLESVHPQLKSSHLIWNCTLTGPTGLRHTSALIDSGTHMVLIKASFVKPHKT